MAKEYDPGLLYVGPNHQISDETIGDRENTTHKTALLTFLLGAFKDKADVEAMLFAGPVGDDAIVTDVEYDRFTTEKMTVNDDNSIMFDQLVLLEDDENPEQDSYVWCAASGMFSMAVHDERGQILAQYIFITDRARPMNGQIYHGYAVNEATRVRGKHLSALGRFMNDVYRCALAENVAEFSRYAKMVSPSSGAQV